MVQLFPLEDTFDTQAAIAWAQVHGDVPIFAITIYLGIIFTVPDLLKDHKGFQLRSIWAVWNLLLSAFSIAGASRTLPHLVSHLMEHGFQYTCCHDANEWFLNGRCGFWVSMFIFSKIPELIDTVFLVLQKKPVIFLHWFHHVTVLLYCWHAYISGTAPGLWYATVNYCVHSVMYFYYFLSISGGSLRKMARPFAPFITTFQLLQMVLGGGVTVYAATNHHADPTTCVVNAMNMRLGCAMYGSYFVLFAVLFYNLYVSPSGKHRTRKDSPKKGGKAVPDKIQMEKQVCGVDLAPCDAAGFFHSSESKEKPDAKGGAKGGGKGGGKEAKGGKAE